MKYNFSGLVKSYFLFEKEKSCLIKEEVVSEEGDKKNLQIKRVLVPLLLIFSHRFLVFLLLTLNK